MGAAITLLVILTVSVFVVRIAAVALRLTGMPADIARFQARSAFSGAGFTTSESEAVVNHPIRRRLIGLLMLWGNIGLVTVIATFIVSFVGTEKGIQRTINGGETWAQVWPVDPDPGEFAIITDFGFAGSSPDVITVPCTARTNPEDHGL